MIILPSLIRQRPISLALGFYISGLKKAKDPRAVKRSEGPSVVASITRLLSVERRRGSGDGKTLKPPGARFINVASRLQSDEGHKSAEIGGTAFAAVTQRQLFRLGSLARLRLLRSGFNKPVPAVLERELIILVEGYELRSA